MNNYRYVPNYRNTKVPDRSTKPRMNNETFLPRAAARPWAKTASVALPIVPSGILAKNIVNEGIIAARGTESSDSRKLNYMIAAVAALAMGLVVVDQMDKRSRVSRVIDFNSTAIIANAPAQAVKPAETIEVLVEKPVATKPVNKGQVASAVANKSMESRPMVSPIKESTVDFGKIMLERPLPILMYHKISENKTERFRLPMDRFEEQLKYLQSNGFQTITVSDLLKGPVPDNAVILTFDDIGLTFYERAYPLLKKYNMKATAFVIVGDLRSDGKGFTWKILKEMEESGLVDVESHTMNHLNMKKCDAEVIKEELTMSRNLLQAILWKRITFIAWPFGAHTPEAVKLARNIGYAGAVGIDDYLTRKKEIDLSNIGRIEVDGRWDDAKFQSRMDAFKEKGALRVGLASTKSKSP